MGNSCIRVADHPANPDFLMDHDEGLSLIIQDCAPALNEAFFVGREIQIREADIKLAVARYLEELQELARVGDWYDYVFAISVGDIENEFNI